MQVNHEYLVEKALQKGPGARILDYGCGAAETVEAGLQRGLDIWGADVFYAGGDRRGIVEQKGLLGSAVSIIENGRAPYPDGHFDLVVSNYVLEHVEDLDTVLADVRRLLKPGGHYLTLFPALEVWREGHCGIPFLHRFSRESRVRYWYALSLRRLGLGHHKADKSPTEWTRDFLEYLDRYTFYRRRRDVLASFQRYFDTTLIEDDYIRFRLKKRGLGALTPLTRVPLAAPLGSALFRRLAGLHVLATPVEPSLSARPSREERG